MATCGRLQTHYGRKEGEEEAGQTRGTHQESESTDEHGNQGEELQLVRNQQGQQQLLYLLLQLLELAALPLDGRQAAAATLGHQLL